MCAWLVCFFALWHSFAARAGESKTTVPEPDREFRGGWVASVANIDWPSSKNLTSDQQKKEMLAILDRSVQLKLNAIVLQVRPACDAIYPSELEPWSEYLTGQIGRPPHPYYDPLEFAVTEAHKRGLELHAWFNPYRARLLSSHSPVPQNHISKTHPDWAKRYVKYLWLDPGEPGVQDHNVNVIMDVVKRYDVDGIHFDDYFYPYQDRDETGKLLDFPDKPSWDRYKESGGKLSRNDWRRENVNMFVERLSKEIRKEKPWVKFGISPFGIWKPGYPKQIRGLNAYEALYADARKWFVEGWLDYCSPQLYWNIDAREQSFPVLLKWWVQQNKKDRHLWPGISTARVGNTRGPEEIVKQIKLTRQQKGAGGVIHWSFKSLGQNRRGISDMLMKDLYRHDALIPASPWMGRDQPSKPSVTGGQADAVINLQWHVANPTEKVWLWVLQKRIDETWHTEILPGEKQGCALDSDDPGVVVNRVALRAVNRYGNLSEPAILELPQTDGK